LQHDHDVIEGVQCLYSPILNYRR